MVNTINNFVSFPFGATNTPDQPQDMELVLRKQRLWDTCVPLSYLLLCLHVLSIMVLCICFCIKRVCYIH